MSQPPEGCRSRRRKLVAQLARVGTAEQQAACRARLDELEPPIRYCAYQLDKADGGAARAAKPNSPVTTQLQVRAGQHVHAQMSSCGSEHARGWHGNRTQGARPMPHMPQERLAAFETNQPNGMAEMPDDVSGFEWRGAHYPAPAETVRAALAPVAAAEQELSSAPAAATGAQGSGDARLVKLDRLGNAYVGALAAVQSAIANGVLHVHNIKTCTISSCAHLCTRMKLMCWIRADLCLIPVPN